MITGRPTNEIDAAIYDVMRIDPMRSPPSAAADGDLAVDVGESL